MSTAGWQVLESQYLCYRLAHFEKKKSTNSANSGPTNILNVEMQNGNSKKKSIFHELSSVLIFSKF